MPTLIAAKASRAAAVAMTIEQLGGHVEYRNDAVDYIRAQVPLAQFTTLACSPGVEALEVDGDMASEDVTLPRPPLTNALEPVGARQALRQPIDAAAVVPHRPTITFPFHEMGIDRFVREHPTADGRGITIAFVEWVPDLLDVQTWSISGRHTTVLRPVFDWPAAPHRNIVTLSDTAVDDDGTAVVLGHQYRVPGGLQNRSVWVGAVDERSFDGYYGSDLTRDGNRSGNSPYIGMLRDPATRQVWVDVDQNRDWTDDKPFQCGAEPALTLGHDNPRTPQRDSMAVLALCDDVRPLEMLVVPTANRHITTLTSAAAAAAFPHGGRGIAPGAHILPVLQFDMGRISRLVEACLAAFRDPRADILTTGLTVQRRLHDGQSVAPLILDRAVHHYGKLLFSAVGNSPTGLETLSEAATASAVISVGAYVSPATLAATHGIPDAGVERPYALGVHGPRADGLLKPDLIASAAAYVPSSSAWPPPSQTQVAVSSGQRVAWGTSLSAPAAASATALLLSAARQEGLAPSAAAVRSALLASARHVPGYSLAEQGRGILDLPAAWEALRRDVSQRLIDVSAPVSTVLTTASDVNPSGAGLFEREGWSARDLGKRTMRSVVLTRRDGPQTPERFTISVIGDRATFVVPTTVILPINTPVSLPVTVTPDRLGVRGALLRVTDSTGGWTQIPLMIVVAHDMPPAERGGSITLHGAVPFARFDRHFIRVPPGVDSLRVEADATTVGIRPQWLNPAGQAAPFAWDAWNVRRGPWTYSVERPEPGVWELVLHHREQAGFGLPTGARPAAAPYAVSVKAGASAQRHDVPSTIVTIDGILSERAPFTLYEFYIGPGPSTIEMTSHVAAHAGCQAEHRLILERCERDACTTALGSGTALETATVSAAVVPPGLWRGVIWRASPSTCRQGTTLRVSVRADAPRVDGTASREP